MTGLFAFLLYSTAFAQVPTISAAQYIITIQSNQPNDFDNYPNVSYSRQYLFYDITGTLTSTIGSYGYGNFTQTMYVTEAKKPETVSARHSVNYQYYYCENYDPNCEGGLPQARQAGSISSSSPATKNKKDPGATESGRTMIIEPNCGSCWWQNNSFYSLYNSIPLSYPNYDTTFIFNSNSVTISVRPAGDNNYNLPSSDNIAIKAEGEVTGYTWEYQVLEPNSNTWSPVPSGLVQSGGTQLILNGQSLLGSNWMNHINKTIIFRLRNSTTGVTSNILIYTHRLSSPKIVSVQTFQNPCFGFDTAYIKVKFDRMLLTDEKVNVFLKDTALGLDYSALNLSNTDIDAATTTYTWPRELVQGAYKVSLIGKYHDIATYTGAPGHFSFAKITDPELVRFYLNQESVLCYGGNSGKITVAAKGGVGNYKYELLPVDSAFQSVFTNFTSPVQNPVYGTTEQTINGFNSQVHKVRVRDGNNCMNRDSIGREIFREILVRQPAEALAVTLLNVSPITSSDVSNGSIKIRLAGGSPFVYSPEVNNYKKYQFEWRDSVTNALINNYTLDTVGKFETVINNLSNGTYTFKAWDASYGIAPSYNQQGCYVLLHIKITRPAPLTVSVVVDSVIKCYGNTNGKLKALAAGGVPVTTDSVVYNFTWYKLVSGSFSNLNVNDSMLRNIGAGEYKVEIRDKYNNLKQSNLFNFTQPALIAASSSVTSSSCFFTPDGSMSVTASGGTAPYSYEWSTGHFTPTVANVAGGDYVVVIKDANLCLATKQVTVTSPAKINVTQQVTPVGCNGSTSGTISLTATGGAGGYTYLWSNGNTTAAANNLSAGRYWYRVTDANGCYDTDTLELDIPEAYSVTAGADRKICIGQTIQLKAQVSQTTAALTTVWNGPQGTVNGNIINVNTAGTYIVTVTNATGCQKKDTVLVTAENATVATSFTVSTQAFAAENTTLVNISPSLQDSATWLLPVNSAITLISQSKTFCELKFADTGRYVVGIRAYYSNGCIDEKYKEINVVKKESFTNLGNQGDAFLKQFGLFPNPTSGNFTLNLLFNAVTVARVRVINILTNTTISDRMLQSSASYSEQFSIGNQPAGTYIVLIETAKGNFVHKLNKL